MQQRQQRSVATLPSDADRCCQQIGVSNYPKKQLAALLQVAKVKPAVNQCQMSMANQENEMLQYCSANGITFEGERSDLALLAATSFLL